MRKLTYFALGGTIASTANTSGRGASPSIPAVELANSIAATERQSVDIVQFMQVASPEITLPDLIRLTNAIGAAVERGSSGIVVSQGTDTLEESAFVLDLLWSGDEPIVFTGAMRNPTPLAAKDRQISTRHSLSLAAMPRALAVYSPSSTIRSTLRAIFARCTRQTPLPFVRRPSDQLAG